MNAIISVDRIFHMFYIAVAVAVAAAAAVVAATFATAAVVIEVTEFVQDRVFLNVLAALADEQPCPFPRWSYSMPLAFLVMCIARIPDHNIYPSLVQLGPEDFWEKAQFRMLLRWISARRMALTRPTKLSAEPTISNELGRT